MKDRKIYSLFILGGTVGKLSLWNLYNLFTGANKSTFIDQFLYRSVHAFEFTEKIRHALEGKAKSWYLN
jgi:hypothetical protein